jgi:C4-dicarboxylate transporter, DctM subunit
MAAKVTPSFGFGKGLLLFGKGLLRVDQVTAVISAAIIMVMTFLTVIDVFLRYAFRHPLIWNFDLQTVLIVLVVFLGIGYAQYQRKHIMIDVLTTRLSKTNQLWFQFFNDIIFLVFMALIAWQMTLQAWDAWQLDDYIEGIVRIPIWPAKAAIALGAALLSLTLILNIFQGLQEIIGYKPTKVSNKNWYFKLTTVIVAITLIILVTFVVKNMALEPVIVGWISIIIVLVLLLIGTPIAAATGIVAIWGVFLLSGERAALGMAASKPFQFSLSYIMSVIPLFITMGIFAGLAGFASDAYEAGRRWLQSIPGGLIHATITGMALFAAASGASTAACATFSKMVLPELFRLGVNKSLALGAIACAATLDIMIPPSLTLVTYALLTQQSVGKLLIAGVIPGLLQAVMYMVLVFIRCKIDATLIPKGSNFTWKERFTSLTRAWGIIFLVVVVMGGIYAGIFTPTEAAAIGTFVAFIAVVVLKKRNRFSEISKSLMETATLTGSIVLIIIGGMMLGNLLAQSRLPVILTEFISDLSVAPVVILIAIMIFYLIIGCFMDALSILIITLPVVFPTIVALGYDPVWFGILITITVEVALVSPPYGLNLFMMQATVPGIRMGDLYRGVVWFIVVDVISLAVFIAFPSIVLWLPNMMVK